MLTRQQLKAARAALGITVQGLADLCGIDKNTVSRYETGKTANSESLVKMRRALEGQGIQFLETDGIRWKEDVGE